MSSESCYQSKPIYNHYLERASIFVLKLRELAYVKLYVCIFLYISDGFLQLFLLKQVYLSRNAVVLWTFRRWGGTYRLPLLTGSNTKPRNITRKKPAACLLKSSVFFNVMIYCAVEAELLPAGFLLDFFPESGGNMTTQKNVYFIVTAVWILDRRGTSQFLWHHCNYYA